MANVNQVSPDGGTTLYDIEDTEARTDVASLASAVGTLDANLGIANSRITNLQSVTNQLSNDKADKSDLGTSAYKNSTSVVTDSTDLVESGAVYDVIGFGSTNLIDVTKYTVNGVVVTEETEGTKAVANNTSIANPAVNFRDNSSGMQEYVPIGKYILSFDVVDCEVLPSTQLAFRNSLNQIVKAVQITGIGHYEIKYTTLVPTKISLMLRVGTTGATGNEFVTFNNLTLLGSLDDTKADNSVIGTVEGANASKAWSAGEHFIKDGQFKEVTNPIASGEAINSGNTTDKPIADIVTIKNISVTPSTGVTFNTANAVKIFDKLIMINIVIDLISLSTGSATQIGYVETSAKPSKEVYTAGVSNSGVPLRVAINTSGSIFVYPQTAITNGKVGFSLIYEI